MLRKKLKAFQLIALFGTGVLVFSPPAHANIMTVIITVTNWITTVMEGTQGILSQMSASSSANLSADKMSTEVEVAAAAENASALAGLDLKLLFGGLDVPIASIKVNSTSPSGCMIDKRQEIYKGYAEINDVEKKAAMKKIGEYSGPVEEIDLMEDEAHRSQVHSEMVERGFDTMGFYPSKNLSASDYHLWVDYIQHITIPEPMVVGNIYVPGQKGRYAKNSVRFQQIVAPAQKAMLNAITRYREVSDGESREDMFHRYKAYANNAKRTRATNVKTSGGVEREIAELQSSIMDVESAQLESSKTVSELLLSLSLAKATNDANEK